MTRLKSKLKVHGYLCCDMHVRQWLDPYRFGKNMRKYLKMQLIFFSWVLRFWLEERSFWKGWALVGGTYESPLYHSDKKQER